MHDSKQESAGQLEEITTSLHGRLTRLQETGQRPVIQGVCIDSSHSYDRDDAIWFRINQAGQLVVDITIADVAGFIPQDSPLDVQAREMGATQYGVETVIAPMFPFRLSQDDGTPGDGMLSLSDKGLRPGMTTRITMQPETGEILATEIFPSLLKAEVVHYAEIADAVKQAANQPIPKLDTATVDALNAGPQRYGLWSTLTQLLGQARHKQGDGVLPLYRKNADGRTVTGISEEGVATQLTTEEVSAHIMVEETALLANRAKAQLFASLNIPYMFRVHEAYLKNDPLNRRFSRLSQAEDALLAMQESHALDATDGTSTAATRAALPSIELGRARYTHRRGWHAGLDEYAYAHSTSPLRRYPDVANQRMEHWVFALMQGLEQQLNTCNTALEPDEIHRQCWLKRDENFTDLTQINGTRLLQWLAQWQLAVQPKAQEYAREQFRKYLLDSLSVVDPSGTLEGHRMMAQSVIDHLDNELPAAPYHSSDIAMLSEEMNSLLVRRTPALDDSLQALVADRIERALQKAEKEVLASLMQPDHAKRREVMEGFSADKRFPLLLHLAAETHREYAIPAKVIQERLEHGELKEPQDLATIVAQMQVPTPESAANDPAFADAESKAWLAKNCEDWRALKETILQRFDRNPAFAKGFLKTLEQRYGWEIESSHASLIEEGGIAAIVSLNRPIRDAKGETTYRTEVPPCFSIGHWGKTTRHHARIEFLRALSFGQLQHDTPPKLPYALELMVYRADHARPYHKQVYQEIDTLARDHGITIERHWDAEQQRYGLDVTVSTLENTNGKGPAIFHYEAAHPNRKQAMHEAYQTLMRTSLMRGVQADLFARYDQLEKIPLNADDAIHWMTENSDWIRATLDFKPAPKTTKRHEEVWHSQLMLEMGGSIRRVFEGESTQQEVAGTFATEAALRYLRERASHGDSRVAELLSAYELAEQDKYQMAGGNRAVGFAAQVPYAAHIVAQRSGSAQITPLR